MTASFTARTTHASHERACLRRKTITTRASVSAAACAANGVRRCRCAFSGDAYTLGWRWCWWWQAEVALTPLWQAQCARFMPPVTLGRLPGELLERFAGEAHEALMRLLIFLAPLTVRAPVGLSEGLC